MTVKLNQEIAKAVNDELTSKTFWDKSKANSFSYTTAAIKPSESNVIIAYEKHKVKKYIKRSASISLDGGKTWQDFPLKGNANKPTISKESWPTKKTPSLIVKQMTK